MIVVHIIMFIFAVLSFPDCFTNGQTFKSTVGHCIMPSGTCVSLSQGNHYKEHYCRYLVNIDMSKQVILSRDTGTQPSML